MGEIGNIPPAYRIPPTRPGAGNGHSSQAPRRKPATGEQHPDEQRRRKENNDDDTSHIDEYA